MRHVLRRVDTPHLLGTVYRVNQGKSPGVQGLAPEVPQDFAKILARTDRRYIKRFGEVRFALSGSIVLAGSMLGLAMMERTLWLLALISPFTVLGAGMIGPALASLLSRRTPPDVQGGIMGVSYATNDSPHWEDHTGVQVPLYASGPGADKLPQYLLQSDIFHITATHLGLSDSWPEK